MIIGTEQPRETSALTRFLIRLSSGDPDEVQRYPRELPRYVGLGWTMLMTAALAMTGMGVLLTQITDMAMPLRLLAAFGWGMFVLGIDYLVVGYVDKSSILAQQMAGPGERPRRSHRFATVVRTGVRLLFAAIVGLAVGESLVLGVFGSAADDYLDARAAERVKAELCLADTTLANYRPEVVPEQDCRQQLERAGIVVDEPLTPTAPASPGTGAAPSGAEAQITADYARIAVLDPQIKFQSDRAQCELYPQNFSPEQISALGCSNRPGNGPAHDAALAQLRGLQSEKDGILLRLDSLAKTNAGAIADFVKAQAAAEAAKLQVDQDKRNSPQAIAAEARKTVLDAQLKHILEPGSAEAYGLSERFEATERAVSPWIRWGIRLLFVIADMAPVLMKLTMGPSHLDVMSTMDSDEELEPRVIKLQQRMNERERASGRPTGGNGYRSAPPRPPRGRTGRSRADDPDDPLADGPTGPYREREREREEV